MIKKLFEYFKTVFSIASLLSSLSRSAFAAGVGSPPVKKADLLLDFHFISFLGSGQSFRKENPSSRMSTVLAQPKKKKVFSMCFEPVHHGTLAGSRLRLICSECFLPQSLGTLE